MITCFLRYTINPTKVADFEHYARTWMRLIEQYGGVHHGYFWPHPAPPDAAFSFEGIGSEGPANTAVALFTFPTIDAYEKYRADVRADPDCIAETRLFEQSRCFTEYERTFLRPISRREE